MGVDPDKSNGYEAIAPLYISGRGRSDSGIGVTVVAEWADTLPSGADILDLGCGTGMPVSHFLIKRGFQVYGVDASPTMVAAFRSRFPSVPVECAAVEDSEFFGRSFDAVIAWGLFFLLTEEAQRGLIAKVAGVLRSGARLLFTSPPTNISWLDAMTGQKSISLGYEAYRKAIEAEGMSLLGTHVDVGENFYYDVKKT